MIKLNCPHCNKEFERQRKYYNYALKHRNKLYCSSLCFNLAKSRSKQCECKNCSKKIIKALSSISGSKSGNVFCSRSCATSHNNKIYKVGKDHPNYQNGIGSYRKLLKLEKCNRCGYAQHVEILEIHHIDKNRKNNAIENLEVLCPNCHRTEHKLNR